MKNNKDTNKNRKKMNKPATGGAGFELMNNDTPDFARAYHTVATKDAMETVESDSVETFCRGNGMRQAMTIRWALRYAAAFGLNYTKENDALLTEGPDSALIAREVVVGLTGNEITALLNKKYQALERDQKGHKTTKEYVRYGLLRRKTTARGGKAIDRAAKKDDENAYLNFLPSQVSDEDYKLWQIDDIAREEALNTKKGWLSKFWQKMAADLELKTLECAAKEELRKAAQNRLGLVLKGAKSVLDPDDDIAKTRTRLGSYMAEDKETDFKVVTADLFCSELAGYIVAASSGPVDSKVFLTDYLAKIEAIALRFMSGQKRFDYLSSLKSKSSLFT